MTIETAAQLAQAACAASKEKTLYVFGAYGGALHEENKQRALAAYAYNRKAARVEKIRNAEEEVFGFDCSGLIKGLLWGWNGDKKGRNGGASYASNGVPDQNADGMFACCADASEDFSDIRVGEAVWLPGHIGIYIGEGLAVESSPKWADGVQVTACNCSKAGYHRRNWKKHGKLPYVTYDAPAQIPMAVLSRGDQGKQVRVLQRLLVSLGYSIGNRKPVDGSFGPKVEAAICALQREYGLTITGKVDESTWRVLLEV